MKRVVAEKRKSFSTSEKGVSVPEILVVFLIGAILVVLAIPQLAASLQSNRVNTLNAAIASKTAEARIQAVKRNAQVSLKIDSQNRRIWIESAGTMIGGAENYTFENQIDVTPSSGTTVETVTFNSFGNLQTAPPTITVSNSKFKLSKTLQVSLSGKITVGQMIKNP